MSALDFYQTTVTTKLFSIFSFFCSLYWQDCHFHFCIFLLVSCSWIFEKYKKSNSSSLFISSLLLFLCWRPQHNTNTIESNKSELKLKQNRIEKREERRMSFQITVIYPFVNNCCVFELIMRHWQSLFPQLKASSFTAITTTTHNHLYASISQL
jgi:hypothetical protein